MYENVLSERLVQLRMLKGVSAREMSLELGMSESYINQIENKRTVPSMQTFFDICEYLSVTPKEFFDVSLKSPPQAFTELIKGLEQVEPVFLEHIAGLVAAYNHRSE